MLAKVNRISGDNRKVAVTQLDVDDLGSVVPLRDLELWLPASDDSVVQTLRNSLYVAIFTDNENDENNSTVVLANGISQDELNREKEKTIEKANKTKTDGS